MKSLSQAKKKLVSLLLVASLALGLHFILHNLSGELTTLFPHLLSEQRPPTPSEPLIVQKEEPDSGESFDGAQGEPKFSPSPLNMALEENPEGVPLAKRPVAPPPAERRPLTGWVRVSAIPHPVATPAVEGAPFSIPPALLPAVEFWQRIYGIYHTKQVVIHDDEDLGTVYSVLDLTEGLRSLDSDSEKKAYREAVVEQEISRVRETLPLRQKDHVRSQTGLKDRFLEGVVHAGRYLPYFEEIFLSYGIPKEISRLPFVESLFKERALSKVNAAGLWQFMAGTARHYLVVDSLVDERYDPIRSCHAAARLLLKNHNLLKSWPLAINAYNSGPANLLRAVTQLGTRDIATIVLNHRGGGYGFASRNFYPSFLAALTVYENRGQFFGEVRQETLWDFDSIQLPGTMTLPEVAFLANMTLDELRKLNPAFTEPVIQGRHPVPVGSEIRILPNHQKLFASRFLDSYNAHSIPRYHVVSEGETPALLARQYGVSEGEITSLNHRHKLREGEVVMIPTPKTVASDLGNPTL